MTTYKITPMQVADTVARECAEHGWKLREFFEADLEDIDEPLLRDAKLIWGSALTAEAVTHWERYNDPDCLRAERNAWMYYAQALRIIREGERMGVEVMVKHGERQKAEMAARLVALGVDESWLT